MYILLWFGPRRFTTLSVTKMPVSLKLNGTFISKDDLEIFILLYSIALGPCKRLLLVLCTNELAVAASTKGPPKQGATSKNSSKRDAIATVMCSYVAVISSSFLICSFTTAYISMVIFDGRPDPGLRPMRPVSMYFFTNFVIPTRLAFRLSLRRSRLIIGSL